LLNGLVFYWRISHGFSIFFPWNRGFSSLKHGSLNVPIEHHPTIRYMVYNGYYKVMSNIPKMGQLPTPVKPIHWIAVLRAPSAMVSLRHPPRFGLRSCGTSNWWSAAEAPGTSTTSQLFGRGNVVWDMDGYCMPLAIRMPIRMLWLL
jgi:hypothetical protein